MPLSFTNFLHAHAQVKFLRNNESMRSRCDIWRKFQLGYENTDHASSYDAICHYGLFSSLVNGWCVEQDVYF